MERKIRTSAKALIVKDGKMLVNKMTENGEVWYSMPGGGQNVEELLPETVCREVAEELGVRVECGEMLFVLEGLHGESHHRIDLVFRCEYLGEIEDAEIQSDTNQTGWAWLDIDTLNTQPLFPSKLRRSIMNYCQGKPYCTYLGNENMGDPECVD